MAAAVSENRIAWISLFGSLSTLLCCALPSLLVLLGFGATVASLLSAAPWIAGLSRQKAWVFAFSGVLIAGNFVYVFLFAPRLRARAEARCSTREKSACSTADRVSRAVLWVSAAIYLIGFLAAYVLGPALTRWA